MKKRLILITLAAVLLAPLDIIALNNVITHNTDVDRAKASITSRTSETQTTSKKLTHVPGVYKPPPPDKPVKVDIERSNAMMKQRTQALLNGQATTYEDTFSGREVEKSVHEFGDNSNNTFIDPYTFTNGIDPNKTFKGVQNESKRR